MIFYPTFYELCVFLVLYLVVYNFSLFLLFWTLAQFISLNSKTIYNLTSLKHNPAANLTLTFLFFSMAGVPPFLGFFTKLIILFSLAQANFFFFYFSFFVLLFFSLYFYMQNIRFLHSVTAASSQPTFFFILRTPIIYLYVNTLILFIILTGFVFFDDLTLLISWFCL